MKRRSGTCLLALAAALVAQQVSAQAGSSATTGAAGRSSGSGTVTQIGNIGIELIKAGDDDYPRAARANWSIPIGKKACDNGKITVTVRNLVGGGTLPYLEAWLGTANNCEMGDRATRASGTAICSKLTIPNQEEIQVANRVSYSVTVDLGPTCMSEGERPIYFLQLASENSNANATSYGVMKLKVDTVPPPAPKDVKGSAGQTIIPLSWTANTYDTVYYRVLADTDPETATNDVDAGLTDGGMPLDGANPACVSGVLRTGKELGDPIPGTIFQERLSGGLKNSYDFNGTQLGRNATIPAAVVAEDQAGNLSPISQVVCLEVKPTTGFWARYKTDVPDGVEPGCACSVPGAPGARRSALLGLPLVLVLGWACARSRTRRRAR